LNPYLLNECKKNDLQIAVNTGSNCFYTDDQAKIIYQPDQPYRKGSWGYVGEHSNVTGMQLEVNATENGPLFQTARENMAAYKFDVPDGTYTVDLYFCEPICPAPKSLYILDSKDMNASANRVFNVSLNGQKIISDFNLAKSCGALMSVIKTYTVSVVNGQGINIGFEPVIGKSIISGIKINRNY
jgi:beta-galactosidase